MGATQTDGGDLTVEAGAAMGGTTRGLQAAVDDTAGLFVEDDSPTDENRYRARFYLDPAGFDPGEATDHPADARVDRLRGESHRAA